LCVAQGYAAGPDGAAAVTEAGNPLASMMASATEALMPIKRQSKPQQSAAYDPSNGTDVSSAEMAAGISALEPLSSAGEASAAVTMYDEKELAQPITIASSAPEGASGRNTGFVIEGVAKPVEAATVSGDVAPVPGTEHEMTVAASMPAGASIHNTAAIEVVPKPAQATTVPNNIRSVPEMGHQQPAPSGIEIKTLITRGDALLSTGDVTSARLFYRRGAESGDGVAALRLGETFDPAFLEQARLGRGWADAAKALYWYLRAHDLGNGDADLVLISFDPKKR